MSVQERALKVTAVVESLERDMELLCITGVEDKLQEGVRSTLELLHNAGIRVSTFTLSITKFLLFTARVARMYRFCLVYVCVSPGAKN